MKKRTIIAGLLFSLLLTGCNADTPHQSAAPLTSEVQPTNDVTGADYDETFGKAQAAFTLSLLQKNAEAYQGENLLLSPYSVMQALAMTANGASGETLSEMEQTLGGIPCAKLNEYLYTQRTGMPDSENAKFKVANSLWIRDDEERLQVKPEFLQKIGNYYSAEAYRAPFDA